ncbi:MAG TPA: glycosyltransferase, partial [Polyangia bacterium]
MTAIRPKLIYLVTEDWYFCSHRLPMARAAQRAGFDVAVATRVAEHGERIRAEGFALHPLRWRRRDIGPRASLRAVAEIYHLYSRERPLLVHHVALKPSVLGGVAALLAGVPAVVNAVTGVGFVGSSPTLRARLLRRPMDFALARLLERPNSRVIVQNEDDRALLLSLHAGAAERVLVIRGSGVDTAHFQATPEPPEPPVIAGYAGRLLADKGIAALVEAHQSLHRRGSALALRIAGTPDPDNPSSIDAATLAAWRSLPGITWLGQVDDIRTLWAAV